MVSKKQKRSLATLCIEFVKLQIAGNILFIGTLLGTFVADKVLSINAMVGVVIGSIVGNIIFFIVDRDWVFKNGNKRRSAREIYRFIVFMTINFFLNIILIKEFSDFFREFFPGTVGYEHYLGLVSASLFFTIWSYLGLKFWVFAPARQHAVISKHHGITPRLHHKQGHRS